jgi:hypothetical protein
MAKMIFVNIAVADVEKSVAFYEAIGATRNKDFSEPGAAAMMAFSDTIAFMLLSHERFNFFTPKAIPDSRTSAAHMLAFSEDSREDVIARLESAVAAGGKADPTPVQDMPFMYGRSFEDLDGHIIEIMWMDVEAATAAMGGAETQTA